MAAIDLIATGLLDEEPEPDSRIAFTSGTEKTTLQIIEERTGKVATISATGAATTGAVGYGAQFLGAVHIIPAAAAKGVATAPSQFQVLYQRQHWYYLSVQHLSLPIEQDF